MNLESELFTWLKANILLVSGRVYNMVAPQDVSTPYLVFQKLNRIPGYAHDGATGFDSCRVQFTAVDGTIASAEAVLDQLEAALSGFRGSMGALAVGSAFLELATGSYDSDIQLYQSIADYTITIQ